MFASAYYDRESIYPNRISWCKPFPLSNLATAKHLLKFVNAATTTTHNVTPIDLGVRIFSLKFY